MSLTPEEKQRGARLLEQGVPAEAVARQLKKSRVATQTQTGADQSSNRFLDFGKGILKGIGDAGVSIAETGDVVSDWMLGAGDKAAAYATSKIKDVPYADALAKIEAPTKVASDEMKQSIAKGYELTKATNAEQEAGKITGEIATWLIPQAGITKKAKVLGLGGKIIAEGIGGAGTGYLLGGQDRETDALYGGLGGIGGELVAPVLGGLVSKTPRIKSLRDVFKKGSSEVVEDVAKTGAKDITDVAPLADDIIKDIDNATTNIEEVIADPKTGLTKKNQPLTSKAVDTSSDLLSEADKRSLAKVLPERYAKGKEVLDLATSDYEKPTLYEWGAGEVMEAVDLYLGKNAAAGAKIGAIKKRLSTEALRADKQIDGVIDAYRGGMPNVKIDDAGVEIVGNTAFKKSGNQLKEIDDILSNIKAKQTVEEVNLGIEELDNNFIRNVDQSVSTSVSGQARKLRKELVKIRNSYMSPEELADYKKYADTIDFANKFKKDNVDKRMLTLVKSAGAGNSMELKKVSDEIMKVTGVNILEDANMIHTMVKNLPKDNPNITRMAQIMGNNIPMSVYGLAGTAGTVTKNTLQSVFGTTIMKEMDKAGMTRLVKIIDKNIIK